MLESELERGERLLDKRSPRPQSGIVSTTYDENEAENAGQEAAILKIEQPIQGAQHVAILATAVERLIAENGAEGRHCH